MVRPAAGRLPGNRDPGLSHRSPDRGLHAVPDRSGSGDERRDGPDGPGGPHRCRLRGAPILHAGLSDWDL